MNWYNACVHPDGHFWRGDTCVECGAVQPMQPPPQQEYPVKSIEPRATAEIIDGVIVINNTDAPLPWIVLKRPMVGDTEVTVRIADNDEDKTIIEVTGYSEVTA